MSSVGKSRWAEDDEETRAHLEQKKREKEAKKRAKEERLRKQEEEEQKQASHGQNVESTNGTTSGAGGDAQRPTKRRRLSTNREGGEDEEEEGDQEEGAAKRKSSNLLRFAAPEWNPCRHVDNFDRLNAIEEGSYGWVSRAKETATGEVIAIKKLKMENAQDGFPITGLREIQTLLEARHPNIVRLREIVMGDKLDE